MKKYLLSLLFIPALGFAAEWHSTPTGFTATSKGVQQDITVEWYSPRCVRIVKTPQGDKPSKQSLAVIAKPDTKCAFSTAETAGVITTRSEALTVSLDTQTGLITFLTTDTRRQLLTEAATPDAFMARNDVNKHTYTVRQTFKTDPDIDIFGLGQLQDGQISRRGITRRLDQNNTEDFTPFIQTTAGWGLYWDNYASTTYRDTPEGTSFTSETGDMIDYYFLYGAGADGVIAQTRMLTGDVPMMPLWSYGFMQSKERYKSQYEGLDVLRRYRRLGIPCDVIIQDWQYWGDNRHWNAMEFLNPKFPDPKAMTDSIHSLNARMMISIWSSFGPETKPYADLARIGALMKFETWPQSALEEWPPRMDHPSGVTVYDCYNPKARDIYWSYLDKGLRSKGLDGWWMDSTEPDHFNQRTADFDFQTPLGSYRSLRNAYPLVTVGGVYDHQRQTTDERTIILTRSGYLGQQRYAANVWSGDTPSSWETLRRQIAAGLSWQMLGMPHWNCDLGGFFCGSYNKKGMPAQLNPAYRELYVRWMQFGVFTPMMRSHGADAPRELYLYGKQGEPVYDALVEAVRLRYKLLPYIYSTAWDVSAGRTAFMRPLAMDFPKDKQAVKCKSEYLFGRSLLVAPVVHAQYTPEGAGRKLAENEGWNRQQAEEADAEAAKADFSAQKEYDVYLPQGQWWDFLGGKKIAGGQTITQPTQLCVIPLYVRAGSIIPLGPDVQYTGEKPWDNLEIRLYPGADADFTLYEDDGHTYAYERGENTRIAFHWDNDKRTLTIADRQGSYPGMIAKRTFRITMPDGTAKTIEYKGKKTTLKIKNYKL